MTIGSHDNKEEKYPIEYASVSVYENELMA